MSNAEKPAASLLSGRMLGDFLVAEKLAEGGVGATYHARQTLLGRDAVIKVLLSGADADGYTQSRFLREARLASRIEHPHAVQVYAFGAEPDGLLWIAMELVRGKSLSAWLKENGPIPLVRFAPFFDALCDVVDAVHEKGIVHRDIKPSNVMVTVRNGRLLPKLLDLGIATIVQREQQAALPFDDTAFLSMIERTPTGPSARSLDLTSSLSGTGGRASPEYEPRPTPALNLNLTNTPSATLTRIELAEKLSITREAEAVGSPTYMAPEQWLSSRDVTPQADIYALGVLAWQSLVGQVPYAAQTTTSMALAHLHAPIPKLPASLPDDLQPVMARALAKKPDERFTRAGDFGRALSVVAQRSQRVLPSLPEALRQEWVDGSPQPLAESVALLEAARTAKTGLEAARRLARVLARFLSVLGLLSRQRLGPTQTPSEAELSEVVSSLRRGRVDQHDWLEVLWHSVNAFANERERHPLPGLIDFCLTAEGARSKAFSVLESLETEADVVDEEAAFTALDDAISKLTDVLRAAGFLLGLSLVRATASSGIFEVYNGCRRPSRTTVNARISTEVEGELYLVDEALSPLLRASPLLQVASPSPGEPPEVFMFGGAGRHGARLISAPREFERQDETVWSWFDADWPRRSSRGSNNGEAQKPPYRGLASFTAADAQDFFGREAEAQAVANRLRVNPLLAMVGPSGVGKSSFVQAGVAPLLAQELQLVVVRPGNTPLATLVAKVKALGVDTEGLLAELAKDPSAFGRRLVAFARAQKTSYLLVVDQFEELLTLCANAEERDRYAAVVVGAAKNPDDPVRVVLTLRDDFLIRAQGLEALKDHLSTGLHLLATPSENDLLRILTQPLKRVGFAFEDAELPRQMVAEVAQQPGALALLSFSATRLWEGRDAHFHKLTRKAYQAMGGVGGALAGHAEENLAAMSEEERGLTREAFRHLVSSSGTRAVLTRAEMNELLGHSASGTRVIERLVDARLLVSSEVGGDDRLEIIHEALLTSWPRLVQWQRENAELARIRDQLRAAARQWNEQHRPRGMLWRDETLTEFRLWRAKYPGKLTSAEEAFASASVREFERGRRWRRGLVIAAFVVLSAGVLGLMRANGRAEANALQALENARESAHRLTLMTAEQGRQEFLAGRPAEAERHLSAALDAGLDNAGVRYMLGKARTALSAELRAVDLGANVTALSTSASFIAVGLFNGAVVLLDAHTLAEKATLRPVKGAVRSVRFVGDGSALVVCGADGVVSVWNPATGSRFDSLQTDPLLLLVCQPTADGKTIVAGGLNSQAHEIDFDGHALRLRNSVPFETSNVQFVRFNPTQTQYVVTMMESSGPPPVVRRHPIHTVGQKNLTWLEGVHGPVRAAAWSPDGRVVALGGEDGTITLWQAATGQKRRELTGHRGAVVGLVTAADGLTLFSTGADGTLRAWNVETGEAKFNQSAHEGRVRDLQRDGDVLVTAGVDGVIRMWSTSGQLRHGVAPVEGGLSATVVDPANDRVLAGSLDGFMHAFRLSSVDFVREVSVAPQTAGFALEPNEAVLWSASFGGPFVKRSLSDERGGASPGATLLEDRAFALAPDGGFIATDRGGRLEIMAPSGQVIRTLAGHADGEGALSVDPSGRWLLATGNFEKPLLYEVATGARREFPEEVQTVTAAFAAGGGSDVWVGSKDGELFWWPERGALRKTKVSRTTVLAIAPSPDGAKVALATFDQKLHLVDATSLAELGTAVVRANASALEFAPDGQLLVLGDRTGTVQVWNTSPLERVDAHKVGRQLFQLGVQHTAPHFLTLTPDGLTVWPL